MQGNRRLICLKVNGLFYAHDAMYPVRRIQPDAKTPWYNNTLKRISNRKNSAFFVQLYYVARLIVGRRTLRLRSVIAKLYLMSKITIFKNSLPSSLSNDSNVF